MHGVPSDKLEHYSTFRKCNDLILYVLLERTNMLENIKASSI